jgi:hypothetical protein
MGDQECIGLSEALRKVVIRQVAGHGSESLRDTWAADGMRESASGKATAIVPTVIHQLTDWSRSTHSSME